MTQRPEFSETSGVMPASAETDLTHELPFSLAWLHAVDPRIFTPETWASGGETTIRLRAADGSIRVNVYRRLSRYEYIEMKDEVYALGPGETEAGSHDVSQFKYEFDGDGELTEFDANPNITGSMQEIMPRLKELVNIAGSIIRASSYRMGEESCYVSDGRQWIEAQGGAAAAPHPPFAIGRIALPQTRE